jgi:hypothetical protein
MYDKEVRMEVFVGGQFKYASNKGSHQNKDSSIIALECVKR